MRISDWSSDVCSSDLMMMARLCVIEPAASRTAWGEAPLEFREKRVQFGGRPLGRRDQRPVVRRADWRERSRTVSRAEPLSWPNPSIAPKTHPSARQATGSELGGEEHGAGVCQYV